MSRKHFAPPAHLVIDNPLTQRYSHVRLGFADILIKNYPSFNGFISRGVLPEADRSHPSGSAFLPDQCPLCPVLKCRPPLISHV
jgi:hypothetical protein